MPSAPYIPMIAITFDREMIPIEMMGPTKVPDPKWKYVDTQGHGHFWDGKNLPTLKWVVTGKEWVGDEYGGEEYEVGEYRCIVCDETVVPRKTEEYASPYLSGLTTVHVAIDDETFSLTEDQYAAAIERWRGILRELERSPRR